ncbi:hypothetical protein [Giesbergeria giesbergeri]
MTPVSSPPPGTVSTEVVAIDWPLPPGGGYVHAPASPEGLSCHMEAINGQVRSLLLVSANEAGRFFLVQ